MSVLGGNAGGEHFDFFHGVSAALNHTVHLVHNAGIGGLGADSVQRKTNVILGLSLNVETRLAHHANYSRHVLQQVNRALHHSWSLRQNIGRDDVGAYNIFSIQQGC